MTGNDFKNWLSAYLEGYRQAKKDSGEQTEDTDLQNIIERIEKEAEKIDAAPLAAVPTLDELLRDGPKPRDPLAPWTTAPPWNPMPIVYNDCGCDPNTACGSTACPRAPKVICVGEGLAAGFTVQ